jgi:D-alanine-D-alanine ligase
VEVVQTARAVRDALALCGWDALTLSVEDSVDEMPALLREMDVGLVFNLVESLGGDYAREAEFPALLERHALPYTGSPATALRAAHSKDVTRRVLSAHRLPVAQGVDVWDVAALDDLAATASLAAARRLTAFAPVRSLPSFPVFAKPARVDGSIGVDQGSVIRDLAALRARVASLLERFGPPVLVEEYLPGTEINVAVVDDGEGRHRMLPTVLDFSGIPAGLLPVVTYACKWHPDSPDYAVRSVPAESHVPTLTLRRAMQIARAAFLALGCAGYGRVDMRLDRRGHPRVIDVNPNPDLDPEAGFTVAARGAGIDYPALISRIAEGAALKENHVSAAHRYGRSRAPRCVAATH